jgi:hypothetical protein
VTCAVPTVRGSYLDSPDRHSLAGSESLARAGLLADAPVDTLAEQVGVPVVAGVLLDHVHQ